MEEEDANPPVAVPMDGTSHEMLPESVAEAPVGVTVITGYLGAGKSTLVNYILNAQHGKKIAVILNEFGEEIGVERAMINEGEGGALVEEWVELANGCVCCTVKHSLVQALEQLVQRKEKLDHILLETTGLADPAPLVSILWLDDQLESAIKLDSIVTVVDAKNLKLQISKYDDSGSFPEAYLQIAFADIVILNKIDLITAEKETTELEALKMKIHGINSLATIICTTRCQVDLDKILNCESYGGKSNTHLEELLENSKLLPTSSRHDSGVSTLSIHQPHSVDLNKVNEWLEDLLWEKQTSMDIYRCKGVLTVHNSDQIHTLQAVREVYEVVPGREWRETEERINKLVFIGRNLDLKYLEDSFKECLRIQVRFHLHTACGSWNYSVMLHATVLLELVEMLTNDNGMNISSQPLGYFFYGELVQPNWLNKFEVRVTLGNKFTSVQKKTARVADTSKGIRFILQIKDNKRSYTNGQAKPLRVGIVFLLKIRRIPQVQMETTIMMPARSV